VLTEREIVDNDTRRSPDPNAKNLRAGEIGQMNEHGIKASDDLLRVLAERNLIPGRLLNRIRRRPWQKTVTAFELISETAENLANSLSSCTFVLDQVRWREAAQKC
jgi:hypothetical protein